MGSQSPPTNGSGVLEAVAVGRGSGVFEAVAVGGGSGVFEAVAVGGGSGVFEGLGGCGVLVDVVAQFARSACVSAIGPSVECLGAAGVRRR